MPLSKSGGETKDRGSEPTSIVSIRLKSSERQALSIKADNAQMALSAFMRVCALSAIYGDDVLNVPATKAPKAKRISNSERTQVALILACLGRLIDTIRAFEDDPVQSQDQQLMLAVLKREIRQTRDQCFHALRRKA